MGLNSYQSKHWKGNEEHLEEGKRAADAFIREHRMDNDPSVADLASHRVEKTRKGISRFFQ